MSAGWGIRVSRSELTGHWIVDQGNDRQGFRQWQDALDEANHRADHYREYCEQQAANDRDEGHAR